MDIKEIIAERAAQEIPDNVIVNFGFGLPVLIPKYIISRNVTLYGENGILGYGPPTDLRDPNLIDGGTNWASPKLGMCFLDSAQSFGIVRGGHLDISFLGGLQVSERGDLANWNRGRGNAGVGGGVDMASCAKKVIVVMEHMDKKGNPKIVKECSYPLTAPSCVDLIVTEMGVFEVTEKGIRIVEIAERVRIEEMIKRTGVDLIGVEYLK